MTVGHRSRHAPAYAHPLVRPAVATIGAVAALLGVVCLTGCSDRPESFQTACNHVAAANDAVAAGDMARPKGELKDA